MEFRMACNRNTFLSISVGAAMVSSTAINDTRKGGVRSSFIHLSESKCDKMYV